MTLRAISTAVLIFSLLGCTQSEEKRLADATRIGCAAVLGKAVLAERNADKKTPSLFKFRFGPKDTEFRLEMERLAAFDGPRIKIAEIVEKYLPTYAEACIEFHSRHLIPCYKDKPGTDAHLTCLQEVNSKYNSITQAFIFRNMSLDKTVDFGKFTRADLNGSIEETMNSVRRMLATEEQKAASRKKPGGKK